MCFMHLQRAMGEFGAISVISGNIIGRTQTLTLYVEGAYKVCRGRMSLVMRTVVAADGDTGPA